MRILFIAYACEPGAGSEYGVGWNVPLNMAMKYPDAEVYVVTRSRCKEKIDERTLPNPPLKGGNTGNLHFLFYDIPRWMYYKNEMGSRWGEQYNYILWQLMVRRKVKEWHQKLHFDVIHHLTFNQYRTPSPGFFLDVPFVMGPIGGAETINPAFEQDLSSHTIRKERIRRKGWDLRLFGWWMKRKDNPKYVLFSTKENQERLDPYCTGYPTEVYPAIGMESYKALWAGEREKVRGYRGHGSEPLHYENEKQEFDERKMFSIIYAGKALDWKGVKLFLHAASKAFVEHGIEDFHIKLVGIRFEEELRRVNEWIEEFQLKEHVEVISFMERAKLLLLLSEAALSAYPAFRDSGSMSVLEASALGCPTICFDVGGQDAFPDDVLLKVPVVNDYNNNLQSFADRLHWAYSNPEQLRTIGQKAKDYVFSNMTWEQKVGHYMDIYKGLIGLRPV